MPCTIVDAWGDDETLFELTTVLGCEGLDCCTGTDACTEAGTLGEPWFDTVLEGWTDAAALCFTICTAR